MFLLQVALVASGFAMIDPPARAPVQMVVTVEARHDHKKPVAALEQEDIKAFERQQPIEVSQAIPLRGADAGLELFLLVDDAVASAFASQIGDLQQFLEARPPGTSVGVGYMRNATVEVPQDLTADHAAAAKKLRIPLGSPGVMASPYLSLRDLISRWPRSANRREVIFITSGVDPLGDSCSSNAYLDSTIEKAQREGVIVYAIYTPPAGHRGHSFWRLTWGQNHLAQLAEETGGEAYMLGYGPAVSFAPYLEQIAEHFEHQYRVTLWMKPEPKGGLRPVRFATEVPNAEVVAADRVWVPGTQDQPKK